MKVGDKNLQMSTCLAIVFFSTDPLTSSGFYIALGHLYNEHQVLLMKSYPMWEFGMTDVVLVDSELGSHFRFICDA